MNGCEDQFDTICKDEFSQLHAKLDRLDEAIRGNGRPGILIRLDRLEQDAKRQAKLVWLLLGAAATSLGSAIVAWVVG